MYTYHACINSRRGLPNSQRYSQADNRTIRMNTNRDGAYTNTRNKESALNTEIGVVKLDENMESRRYPCESCSDAYEISLMSEEAKKPGCRRRNEAIKMLTDNFLRDETLVRSLRLGANFTGESDESDYNADENLLMETVLDVGHVLLAVHKETGRLSGALVLLIHERSKMNESKVNACESRVKSQVIKDFFGYMETIEREGNIFDIYPSCDVWAEVNIIAVNKLDRRKGLAFDLYKAGFELAKTIPRVRIFAATCTSTYSVTIAAKIGQKPVFKFDVTKLRDPREGKPVFQDTVPHNVITIMVLEL